MPSSDGAQPPISAPPSRAATLGLPQATAVGVGAIVGGGIFVLGGAMVAQAGPAALLALALNGVLALLTAMSFAEMATTFPENGGEYAFARRALSVRSAFAVGWIVFFAYAVAAALYAIGFAAYASLFLDALAGAGLGESALAGNAIAVGSAIAVALVLARWGAVGGVAANIGKVAVFGLLIAAGLTAFIGGPRIAVSPLSPFFSGGGAGILAAMGLSFIILQGFGNIAAVAGNIRDPVRNVPRAMFLSLAIAMTIYLPLVFFLVTVGVPPGGDPVALASSDPEGYFAAAVGQWMGDFGWWVVTLAALLAMISALQANLMAASGVGRAMALDRTLPRQLAGLHPRRQSPTPILGVAALLVTGVVLLLPDPASAGAAASLIFLLCFALVHALAWLVRRRLPGDAASFRAPLFPLVPIVGGLACAGVALYQLLLVPTAGWMTVVWLGFGLFFYFGFLSARAEAMDHAQAAHNPELMRSRGDSETVLVPVANAATAGALAALASALAPVGVGRVIALQVVIDPKASADDVLRSALAAAHAPLDEAAFRIHRAGHAAECLLCIASEPWSTIRRVARERQVDSVLLGLPRSREQLHSEPLNALLAALPCDVALYCAPKGFDSDRIERVLVPVSGSLDHDRLRARVLGAMRRRGVRHFTFLRVLAPGSSEELQRTAGQRLERMLEDEVHGHGEHALVISDDPTAAILRQAAAHDLVLLGSTREGRRGYALSPLLLRTATEVPCASLILSRHAGS